MHGPSLLTRGSPGNLLAVIMGHSDLIRSALREGDAMSHDVEQIRRASERAATLTRQLLAFSRRQFLQPQVIDVDTLVGNLATMLRRLIGEDVQLELRLDPQTGRVSAYVSGYTADQLRSQTDLGADATLLPKPFTSDGLLRKIREVLDQPRRR
jgi:signal transduction histidine kinase